MNEEDYVEREDLVSLTEERLAELNLSWKDIEAVSYKIGDEPTKVASVSEAKKVIENISEYERRHPHDYQFFAWTKEYILFTVVEEEYLTTVKAIPRHPTDKVEPEPFGV